MRQSVSFLKDFPNRNATDADVPEIGKRVAEALKGTGLSTFAVRFARVKTVVGFDGIMNGMYDEADARRIWVKTVI
jgi:hypothetical protein